MWPAEYFSLVIIAVIWGTSFFSCARDWTRRNGRRSFILLLPAVIVFAALFYVTRQQFFVWYNSEPGKYLIPPYNEIYYFIYYTLTQIWGRYVISLGAALIFLFLAILLNKRHEERFFWPEEPYFLALALFLSGHPGWVIYLLFILLLNLLVSCCGSLIAKSLPRLSFYYLWLPMVVVVIFLDYFLRSYWPWYGNLILSN